MATVNLSNSSSSLMNLQLNKSHKFLQFDAANSVAKIQYPISYQFHPKTHQIRNLPSLASMRSAAAAASSAADPSDAAAAAKPQSLKSRLPSGETLCGLFLCSFSSVLAEIAGLSGYDFVVVDLEHGFGGISDALPCLHALAATRTPAILGLPENSATWAKKALDLGPQGVMFPMIDSPKAAEKAVSYCRYPRTGVRGAAHSIVRASGYGALTPDTWRVARTSS